MGLGSFFEDVLDYVPAGAAWDYLDLGGTKAKREQSALEAKQNYLRQESKKKQLELLNSKRGPVVTPQMEARIKALETESTLPFHLDPSVQADYRRATVGGAQALSGVQNKQLASGARGGFSNVGSISGVYDRMGVQLADLGQKQQQIREQKRDVAAAARQDIADAQIAYENSLKDAEAAIEAGDSQAMMAALNQAYAARDAIKARQQQMLLGIGQLGVGAMTANPGSAASGAKNVAGENNINPAPMQQPYAGPSPSDIGNYRSSGVIAGGYKPSYQYGGIRGRLA